MGHKATYQVKNEETTAIACSKHATDFLNLPNLYGRNVPKCLSQVHQSQTVVKVLKSIRYSIDSCIV